MFQSLTPQPLTAGDSGKEKLPFNGPNLEYNPPQKGGGGRRGIERGKGGQYGEKGRGEDYIQKPLGWMSLHSWMRKSWISLVFS